METQQEEYIYCKGCRCRRHKDEYEIYKGQRRKCCMKCKAKRERNKDKKAEYSKQYYQENKDKKKQHYQVNREEILEERKQYRENNKQKIAEYDKRYRENAKCEHNKEKGRCNICNPQMYLVKLQRYSLWRVLRQSNLDKTKHTIEYLGCSPEYFKQYIQNKMTDEMTFENINIDHIKPVSQFNLNDEQQFLDCCHYTNLQPLLAKDNREKHNKWTYVNEIYWLENIKGKETTEIYYSWKK